MKSTEEVTNFLGSINNINSGGCLIAAYAFWLYERRAKRAEGLQIVELSDWDGGFYHNKEFLKGNFDFADSNAHFGWTYNKGETVLDSKGIVIKPYAKHVIPKQRINEFCVSSLNYGSWNWMFERAIYVPKIAKELDLDLTHIRLCSKWDDDWEWGMEDNNDVY